MAKLPLEGVRVLDFTVVWAGPYGAMLLADWGAEVIRVESTQVFAPHARGMMPRPPRSLVRPEAAWHFAFPNYEPGPRPWNRYPTFHSHGRNKLSMTVDLRRPEGQEVLHRLVRLSDVIIENNVPETMEKLNITYDVLSKVNPQLIVVRMPGFGLSGPYKNYRSLGTHMESSVGHTWIRGYSDTDPSMRGDIFAADAAAGAVAAFATAMALYHRRRTGRGQLVEMATAEAFISYMEHPIMEYVMNGRVMGAQGNRHPSMAPHGCYPCRGEERWLVLSVATDDEWRALCRVMGDPSWTKEECFSDSLSRWNNQDRLDQLITQWTLEHDPEELMHQLQAAGVAAAAVKDEPDILADRHLNERGFFQELTNAETGTYRFQGPLWRMKKTPNRLRSAAPLLGEHNEYVYKGLLGYSDEDYTRLEREGHIGMDYVEGVKEPTSD